MHIKQLKIINVVQEGYLSQLDQVYYWQWFTKKYYN
jgi:hypothetical protein